MFEATELAPGRVEFAGLANKIEAEASGITGARGEVVVAPTARRKAFELEMAVGLVALGAIFVDVAGVIEDPASRIVGAYFGAELAAEAIVDGFVVG